MKQYQYKENDMLAYALVVLGACESQIEEYGHLTVTQIHQKTGGNDFDWFTAWDWLLDQLYFNSHEIPEATSNRLHNALHYGLIDNPRENQWVSAVKDSDVAKALKATFTPRAIQILLNKMLREV
jgi:hypothetical protein